MLVGRLRLIQTLLRDHPRDARSVLGPRRVSFAATAGEGTALLHAGDPGEVDLQLRLPAGVAHSGHFSLGLERLLRMVSRFEGDLVRLVVPAGHRDGCHGCHIEDYVGDRPLGRRAHLAAVIPAEPRSSPGAVVATLAVTSADLRHWLTPAYAIASEDHRYGLNFGAVEVSPADPARLRFVATDGHRLAWAEIPNTLAFPEPLGPGVKMPTLRIARAMAIRLPAALELSSAWQISFRGPLPTGEAGWVTVDAGDDQLVFGVAVPTGTEFPDYRELLPPHQRTLRTSRRGLLAAARRCEACCGPSRPGAYGYTGIGFQIDPDRTVSVTGRETKAEAAGFGPERYVERIEADLFGLFSLEEMKGPLRFQFQIPYLRDVLQRSGWGETVELRFTRDLAPFELLEATTDPDAVRTSGAILMPMRVDDGTVVVFAPPPPWVDP